MLNDPANRTRAKIAWNRMEPVCVRCGLPSVLSVFHAATDGSRAGAEAYLTFAQKLEKTGKVPRLPRDVARFIQAFPRRPVRHPPVGK